MNYKAELLELTIEISFPRNLKFNLFVFDVQFNKGEPLLKERIANKDNKYQATQFLSDHL